MKAILAIALISIRTAVRSRVVILLLGLLMLTLIGLPLTIKSDGTIGGYVQILVRYTLGGSELLLAMATLWSGVAAVAMEIQDKQIQMLVTKPVNKLQLWLGKWLGLVALNVLALALCGGITYGLLRWTTRPGQLKPAERQTLETEILVARQAVAPQPFEVEAQARQILASRQAQGTLPTNAPIATVYKGIRDSLLVEAHTVRPGGTLTWTFPAPPAAGTNRLFHLRYKLSTSWLEPAPLAGRWSVGRAAGGARYEVALTNLSQGAYTLAVPGSALAGSGALTVTYANVHPQPVTVLFDTQDGLRALFYVGPWTANLARALLLMAARLAFLAALGVTAGSLFSMPVAAFTALFFWFMISMVTGLRSLFEFEGTRVTSSAAGAAGASLDSEALSLFYRGVYLLVQPLQSADALALVATGQNVSWELTARVFALQVLLYGSLLMWLGAGTLRRRELALPSS